ncbi:hypothetical protein Leryth_009445 [Lithospermum erythrorhizon]|nr:hypothetical protein Leryth_009445 [Lithospermum erythrorhizon]
MEQCECEFAAYIRKGADAANFSAICILLYEIVTAVYPQLPAPCITVIGYNGVQVLQNEGYVTADFLASNLEKAWFSLQIQESAAAFLVDAIASKKEAASGISNKASLEQGSSSTNQASPPSDRGILCSDSMPPEATEVIMKDDDECVIEDQNSTICNEPSPSSDLPENTKAKLIDGYASMTKKSEESSKVESADLKNRDGKCVSVKDNPESSNHDNVAKNASFQETDKEAQESTEFDKDENEGVEKASDFNLPNKSNDVLLNIRLPDGSSLQVKLPMVDTLEMVKNYVDNNRPTGFGAYDLAIPYPRHVFSDQDLCKQLSELGLSNRQALVVVLRRPTNSHPKGVSSRAASNYAGSSSASNEGKWALLKRMLAYVNPLSYLAGAPSSTNSGQETQSGMLQYGPNSSLQGDARGAGRPGSVPSNEQASTSGTSSNKKPRQPSSNQFGSNIHTLKRDEDDQRFSDRNTFWNGNSTQFGGDDNGK